MGTRALWRKNLMRTTSVQLARRPLLTLMIHMLINYLQEKLMGVSDYLMFPMTEFERGTTNETCNPNLMGNMCLKDTASGVLPSNPNLYPRIDFNILRLQLHLKPLNNITLHLQLKLSLLILDQPLDHLERVQKTKTSVSFHDFVPGSHVYTH